MSATGHVIVAGIITLCFYYPSHSLSARTSTLPGSLPGEVTHTFTPERARSLVVLPELNCCDFSIR